MNKETLDSFIAIMERLLDRVEELQNAVISINDQITELSMETAITQLEVNGIKENMK
jgi:hypothetical protein